MPSTWFQGRQFLMSAQFLSQKSFPAYLGVLDNFNHRYFRSIYALIKTHLHTIQCYLKTTEHKLQLGYYMVQCAIDLYMYITHLSLDHYQ